MVIYPSFLGFSFGDAILNKQPLRFAPALNPYAKTVIARLAVFASRGNLMVEMVHYERTLLLL